MKRFLRIGGEAFDLDSLTGWSLPDATARGGRDRRGKVQLHFAGGYSRELTLSEADLATFRAWAEAQSDDLAKPAPTPAA